MDLLTPTEEQSLLNAFSMGRTIALDDVAQAMSDAQHLGHEAMVAAVLKVIAGYLEPSLVDVPEGAVLH